MHRIGTDMLNSDMIIHTTGIDDSLDLSFYDYHATLRDTCCVHLDSQQDWNILYYYRDRYERRAEGYLIRELETGDINVTHILLPVIQSYALHRL